MKIEVFHTGITRPVFVWRWNGHHKILANEQQIISSLPF